MCHKNIYIGAEKDFVKELNCNKINSKFWKILGYDPVSHWAVHINTKHKCGITQNCASTKADLYIAELLVSSSWLLNHGFLIDEKALKTENIIYKKTPGSGISVKIESSDSYQIDKMTPDTFHAVFGCYVLGAGASIYCEKPKEFFKNSAVIAGWKTTWTDIKKEFPAITGINQIDNTGITDAARKTVLESVKTMSNKRIKDHILKSHEIQKYIFKGCFEDPYNADWLYEGGILRKNDKIPDFTVTTGSGRSKGTYTVVIKPA